MFPTTETEIYSLIHKLKNNSAFGEDGIKSQPKKSVSELISGPILHICNLLLSTGTFPDEFKIARVTVIHKGGGKNDLNN